MNMAQRTSSAAELTQQTPAPIGAAEPVRGYFEFSPASEPVISLFYLKNRATTLIGEWVILDGFYLSSHGDRPTIAVVVHKTMINGEFSDDTAVPSQITKTGQEAYFLNRDMAEYCVKKMMETGETFKHALTVCHGKTYNNLVDQLEDRDQVGHFEDDQVLIVNVEQPDGEGALPVMIGLVEMLVNKKLHLVHVVGRLERSEKSLKHLALRGRNELIGAQYYSSEAVARMAYKDLKAAVPKPLASLSGRSYEEMDQFLKQNAK